MSAAPRATVLLWTPTRRFPVLLHVPPSSSVAVVLEMAAAQVGPTAMRLFPAVADAASPFRAVDGGPATGPAAPGVLLSEPVRRGARVGHLDSPQAFWLLSESELRRARRWAAAQAAQAPSSTTAEAQAEAGGS